MLNVKDFGAVGDDSHDDTAALNDAIDSGGPLSVPNGTYKVTAPLHALTTTGATIQGESRGAVLKPYGNFDLITATGAPLYNVRLANFSIDATQSTGGNMVRLISTYFALVDYVWIHGQPGTAVFLDGGAVFGAYTQLRQCDITNGNGANALGLTTNNHELSGVSGGAFTWYASAGATAIKALATGMRFEGVNFDMCDTSIWAAFAESTRIDGCFFDRGITRYLRFQGANRSRVTNNTFSTFAGTGQKNMIDVDNSGNSQNKFSNNIAMKNTAWHNFVFEDPATGGPGNEYRNNTTQGLGMVMATGTVY